MARMMPTYCPAGAPPGEKALYEALAVAPETDGWIVLHSLALANHVRQVEGEADFVVIVPNEGVLVVEVKSHKSVGLLDDGRWKLGRDAPTSRGPFQQAREAMYSILDFLQRQRVNLARVPVLHAVWFTHIRARGMLPRTPEWHSWQVLDSGDLSDGAAAAVLRTLKAGRVHLAEKNAHFRRADSGPDKLTAERIAAQLRPRFEMQVGSADLRQARKSQLVTFIEEQYRALDAMADNQAVLFTGPAGSGKTLLAVEAAQREQAQGRTGRLLCFNRLLGRRLSDDLRDATGITSGTFHQEMIRIARIQPPENPGRAFWERELPDLAIEALLERGARRRRSTSSLSMSFRTSRGAVPRRARLDGRRRT
ncbi:MAG: NERD domain-containing protein [Microthrixaceae bacterium]